MDARSLVGMTEGAKKRAGRREVFRATPAARRIYLRSLYRIGERLRPCPGPCSACCPGWCCKGGSALCDGSGVLKC